MVLFSLISCGLIISTKVFSAELQGTTFHTGGVAYHFGPDVNTPGEQVPKRDPIIFVSGYDFSTTAITGEGGAGPRQSGPALNQLRIGHRVPQGNSATASFATYWADLRPTYLANLCDELGYDLYILEYNDTSLPIQQNALLLESFLDDVMRVEYNENGARASVVGYSMGGLVSRYALTKMEHEGKQHNVKTFISYDSPHKGAYISPGIEIFARTALDSSTKSVINKLVPDSTEDSLRAAVDIFDQSSVKQMLALWVGRRADDGAKARVDEMYANPDTKAAHPMYYQFRSELQSMGNYPKKTKNVAISNGNSSGSQWSQVDRPSGAKMLDARTYTAYYWGNDTIFHTQIYDDPWTSVGQLIKQSAFGDTDYVKNVRTQNGLRKYSSSPGSYLKLFQQLDFWWEKHDDDWFARMSTVNITAYPRTTTFIPTTSALDLPTVNLYYSNNDIINSPFDDVYRHNTGENLEHMQISTFLQNKLEESVGISKNWYITKVLSAIL